MLDWLTGRGADARKSKELYGAVVAAARQPEFYSEYGVPDTLNGRYEMIVLVLFQLLERLRAEGAAVEETSRMTLEAFFTDMDDCMREIGVGDLTVPKKVKKAAAGFYERAQAYRAALDGNDTAQLASALEAFIAGDAVMPSTGVVPPEAVKGTTARFAQLAAHMVRQRDALASTDAADVLAGRAFIPPRQA